MISIVADKIPVTCNGDAHAFWPLRTDDTIAIYIGTHAHDATNVCLRLNEVRLTPMVDTAN